MGVWLSFRLKCLRGAWSSVGDQVSLVLSFSTPLRVRKSDHFSSHLMIVMPGIRRRKHEVRGELPYFSLLAYRLKLSLTPYDSW